MKHNALLKTLVLTLALMMAFSVTAFAETEKNDDVITETLTINVVNPPEEKYYLDLLVGMTKEYKPTCDNLGERRSQYDEEMLNKMIGLTKVVSYSPALINGTNRPLIGSLEGVRVDDHMEHVFTSLGVPTSYRVGIVTESGKVYYSNVVNRKAIKSTATYDFATGELKAKSIYPIYLYHFITTFIFAVIIEGIILVLFKFDFKQNIMPVVILNFITQLILTATFGATLIKAGPMAVYLTQIPTEIGVVAVETLLAARRLKGGSEKKKIIYGITANVTTWILSYALATVHFARIMSML